MGVMLRLATLGLALVGLFSAHAIAQTSFVTFESGVTLYLPAGLDLLLKRDPPRPAP